MSTFIDFALGIGASTMAAEFLGASNVIAEKFRGLAIRRLPRKYRARFAEEWAADLATKPTPLTKLLFSIGLVWASRTILVRERHRVIRARYHTKAVRRYAGLLFLEKLDAKIAGDRASFHKLPPIVKQFGMTMNTIATIQMGIAIKAMQALIRIID